MLIDNHETHASFGNDIEVQSDCVPKVKKWARKSTSRLERVFLLVRLVRRAASATILSNMSPVKAFRMSIERLEIDWSGWISFRTCSM